MRSQRKILLPSSPNWLTQKMKMVSSHTLHSSTDCAERLNLVENQNNLITKKENQKIKTNQNYQISKMSFRKVRQNFLFNLADFQKLKPKNWMSFKKHVKKKIAQNHLNMDIYVTTKDLDLDLDRHLQGRIKYQLLWMYSSHFTHYHFAFISTPFKRRAITRSNDRLPTKKCKKVSQAW